MKKLLIAGIVLIFLSSLCYAIEQEDILKLNLNYEKGNLNFINLQKEKGFYPSPNDYSKDYFLLEIYDKKENVLFSGKYTYLDQVYYDFFNETGIYGNSIEKEKKDFSIMIPLPENSMELLIKNEKNQILFRRDISEYSRKNILFYSNYFILCIVLLIIIMLILYLYNKKK